MSQASNYCETALGKALLGIAGGNFGTLSAGPTIYIALLLAPATDEDTGATLTEPSYTGYARVAHSAWAEQLGVPGTFDNTGAITFVTLPGGSPAESVVGFALVDKDTPNKATSNVICYGTASLAIDDGITPQFADGALLVRIG